MTATVNNFAISPTITAEKAEKAPNYTTAQTAELLAVYLANPCEETVKSLAVTMGRTVRSLIAKLSREKVYVKSAYKNKNGEPSVKKNTHVDAISAVLKLSENDAESLTKCNKTALIAIWNALANSVPATPENSAGSTPPMQRGETDFVAE